MDTAAASAETGTMDPLTSGHFLALPRPDVSNGPLLHGVPDTTTLAAHDFDVDTRTGFMPPQAPLRRLPLEWEPWEVILDKAMEGKLKLGDKESLPEEDRLRSLAWRALVNQLIVIPTDDLNKSELFLRRGHHVLAWIMHFYVRTLPPDEDIRIPRGLTIPLLHICNQLQLPPVLTYSDDVLYNWDVKAQLPGHVAGGRIPSIPALDNLRCQTLFTGTKDEEEFYLASARVEFRGVEALELMQATMDEAFVGDDIAFRRICSYLRSMVVVIDDLASLLLDVRKGCEPEFFYNSVRPWLKGQDSDSDGRQWIFEGVDEDARLVQPEELSGPSAGQSSLIHALDIFLGVEHGSSPSSEKWLNRMRDYMPRHHRNFLRHLLSNPRPLRVMVETRDDSALSEAYNLSVEALKKFRDAHVRIVALYIIGPARRLASAQTLALNEETLKGTGGSDLMQFVKGMRDDTANSVVSRSD